jgi:hypothetical protein
VEQELKEETSAGKGEEDEKGYEMRRCGDVEKERGLDDGKCGGIAEVKTMSVRSETVGMTPEGLNVCVR